MKKISKILTTTALVGGFLFSGGKVQAQWSLTGNAIVSGNFLGTTNNQDVILERDNVQAGLLNSALSNTSWGVSALNPATTGAFNTAIGLNALSANTSGQYNTATGCTALVDNTTGIYNTAIGGAALYFNTTGNGNTANGMQALYTNTMGSYNTGIGYAALLYNTTGSYNTSSGFQSLLNNTTGEFNTGIGFDALVYDTSGSYNVAIGGNALQDNTSGADNTAIGIQALLSNTTGGNNISMGVFSLYKSTTASSITTVGNNALYNNTGSWNTALGDSAGYNNTIGIYNTYVGYESGISNKSLSNQIYLGDSTGAAAPKAVKFAGALEPYYSSNYQAGTSGQVLTSQGAGAPQWVTPTAFSTNAWSTTGNAGTTPATNFLGTTDAASLELRVNDTLAGWIDDGGYQDTYFGYKSGTFTGSNAYNTLIGYEVGSKCTSGAGANTAVGDQAFYTNTVGLGDAAFAYEALYANTSGRYNTAIGDEALYSNTTASSVTALGYKAGWNNTTGSWNTFVGDSSGYHNTSGTYNTFLGYNAGPSSTFTGSNSAFLGYNSGVLATTIGSNSIYLGNSSIADLYCEVQSISAYSDRRIKDNVQENVPGLAFITKLKAVTYNLNIHKQNELLGVKDDRNWDGKYDIEKVTQSGFIAQDVEAAAQSIGYDFNGLNKPKTPDGLYALGYTDFVVPLVKAVQELNAKNDSLHTTVDSLRNLNAVVNGLRTKVNSRDSVIDSLRNAFKSIQACLNKLCVESTNHTNGNTGDNNLTNTQDVTLSSTNAPLLYQNSPNPLGAEGAKINYYLPEGTQGATIIFYDTYGNQLKQVVLNQIGNGTLNVNPDNLSNGIYSYSLIVNGNVIDTKRMVLQK